MHVTRIPCMVCNGQLNDGDPVVVWDRDLAHAACSIFIVHPDGSVTTLDGDTLEIAGSALGPGKIMLTQTEWEQWNRRSAASPQ